jgi:hypothetical protein
MIAPFLIGAVVMAWAMPLAVLLQYVVSVFF